MIIIVITCLILISTIDTFSLWGGTQKDEKVVKKDVDTVIGIDLGTTYSCVAIFKNCQVEIIENEQGNRITPSYVSFTSNGERLIGDAAKNSLTSNPQNTIFHIKRLMGRQYDDPSIKEDIKFFPFSVVIKDNQPVVKVKTGFGDKLFIPEEISAMILGKMREIAVRNTSWKESENAVVTVPAYFNDAQRQATKDAGTIAGLNVLRIINEPTGAAIAYGLDKLRNETSSKTVLVFDLGGGTFDFSLLLFEDDTFEVLATNGDTHLGGEDFDLLVMEYFIDLFKKKTGKNIREDVHALQKLRREVEKAKRILSSQTETKLEIESFFHNEDFYEKLTRAKFEALNMDLFRSTLIPVEKVLEDANLEKYDIDEIILIGGSTRTPKIREIIKEFFDGKEPLRNIDSDEAVVEESDDEDESESTAYGAAIQEAILSGEECTQNITVLDVNPLTMGIQIKGGVMSKIIPRNSLLPTKKMESFTTTIDNQDTVDIQVFEGERSMAKDNHFLGKFDLTGIPPASKGKPKIEVKFEIDVNGILKVTAQDKDTGNKKNIVITSDKNRLPPKEIDRMIQDAERFAEQDKKVKERVEAKNELESYVYLLKTQFVNKEKLLLEERTRIENAVEEEIKWLELNPDAKTVQLKIHKKELEDIVTPIMNKFQKKSDNPTETSRPSYEYDKDL